MMIVVLMITITSPKCPFPPVSFLTPMKNILEEAYNEIIGVHHYFKKEPTEILTNTMSG